jgi:hypothetical protein
VNPAQIVGVSAAGIRAAEDLVEPVQAVAVAAINHDVSARRPRRSDHDRTEESSHV